MEFTTTGTLTEWKPFNETIIFPLHLSKSGKVRGGAFLCLPNFEDPQGIFDIKHGEYRITETELKMPHKKILEPVTGTWGTLSVETFWENRIICNNPSLSIKTSIFSLTEKSFVLPGFHPYFSSENLLSIETSTESILKKDIPHDKLLLLSTNIINNEATATLRTKYTSITLRVLFSNPDKSEPLIISFGVWSDNKESYICLEPILGIKNQGNIPNAFVLKRDSPLTIDYTITRFLNN